MAAIKNLQLWCKQQCEGYRDVTITNMTTSFRDGLAFCAILHRHRPDLIDFSRLSKENVYDNNKLAFQVAEEQLGIPALLDAEDMVALKVPDRLSILTYVSQYYNYFHGRSPIGGMAGIKRSTSESNDEPPGKKAVTPTPVKPSPAHLLPVVKTNTHLGQDLPKENPPATEKRVLGDSSNLRSSSCAICGSHVHLVQRHLVDGKLYHRNCFRCKQCSNTLLSGAYKAGTEPGTYICTSHQQPARPWNSGPRSTENKSAITSTTSGDPQKELMKSSHLNKDTNSTTNFSISARPSWSPPGSNMSPGFKSGNAGNKSGHHEGATSPPLTPSRVKIQQAREKFFQSSAGPSADKSPATKEQVLPLNPPQPAGKTTCRVNLQTNSFDTEKGHARQHLTRVLPSPNPSPNRPGGLSPAISHGQSPGQKNQASKSGHTAQSLVNVEHSSKSPGKKLGVGTTTQSGEKDQPVSGPADIGHKSDWKDNRGRVNAPEDKAESPADWPSRLKPVTNRDAKQGDSRKPMDSAKVTGHPAQEKKFPSSIPSPANKDTASSAALPPKKKLIPDKDLYSDLQTWKESPTKEPGQSNRVSTPGPVNTEVASPVKLQEDYIPEEEIQEKVREIEKQLDELELKGVDMEKHLRDCEGDESEDALMAEWFKLIHEKQLLLRLESELMYKSKQQKLEEKQWNIESELRHLMSKPEVQKTPMEKKREKELLDLLVDTVNDRNDIVECLDEDRIRELEEDQMLADMLQKLDVPHETQEFNKKKNKFRWSKIWKQKSKKKEQQ